MATLICGDADESPTEYRRMVDIVEFRRFSGAESVELDAREHSRWTWAQAFIQGAQDVGKAGASGISREVEKIIEALLDLREFGSEDRRDEALLKVNQIQGTSG